MKKKFTNFILVMIILVGLCLLLYPPLSNYYNSFHQTKAITNYTESIAQLDDDEYVEIWDAAKLYNTNLKSKPTSFYLTEEEKEVYNSLLNVGGNGVMGYIEIPTIDVNLPIHHGTSEPVLQVAVGHIEGSSLPTGGESTHCVLSGHRGLPSAKLFTDLDQLMVGDVFMMHILDETLTYEVDQILIVLPHEILELQIVEGMDYCTLTTCTPYGINSHRMLIRGHRVDNIEDTSDIRVSAEAHRIEPIVVAPVVAAPMLLALLILLLATSKKKKTKAKGGQDDEIK